MRRLKRSSMQSLSFHLKFKLLKMNKRQGNHRPSVFALKANDVQAKIENLFSDEMDETDERAFA